MRPECCPVCGSDREPTTVGPFTREEATKRLSGDGRTETWSRWDRYRCPDCEQEFALLDKRVRFQVGEDGDEIAETRELVADGGRLEPYAADVVLARVELARPMFPDEEGDGIEGKLTMTEGIPSAEIVASNAFEHDTALDELIGAVEGAIETLRGEADELRNRPAGGYGTDPHLDDVEAGLRLRAHDLEAALESFVEDVAPPERVLADGGQVTADPHAEPLRVTEADGLALPEPYIGYEGGLVVRTPDNTQQFNGWRPKGRVPTVLPRHFGERDYNPELAPDQVSLKKYGEEPAVFKVEIRE